MNNTGILGPEFGTGCIGEIIHHIDAGLSLKNLNQKFLHPLYGRHFAIPGNGTMKVQRKEPYVARSPWV